MRGIFLVIILVVIFLLGALFGHALSNQPVKCSFLELNEKIDQLEEEIIFLRKETEVLLEIVQTHKGYKGE